MDEAAYENTSGVGVAMLSENSVAKPISAVIWPAGSVENRHEGNGEAKPVISETAMRRKSIGERK